MREKDEKTGELCLSKTGISCRDSKLMYGVNKCAWWPERDPFFFARCMQTDEVGFIKTDGLVEPG